MSESQEQKTFKEDGIRPIESGDIEVADTFEEDGTRPVAKSPDFLLTEEKNKEDSDRPTASENSATSETEQEQSTDTLDPRVVDTFEEDGTRPIMANKYEVVDTINVDGDRPITSE